MTTPRRLAMVNSDGKLRPALPDPPGVTTSLVELRLRTFARTPYDHLLTELGTVDAAERALADGCDAVYVDTFGDYGVERIRAVTRVPVVGAGEASIAAAAAGGRRFSIVTVWPASMHWLYAERLVSCEGGELCAGVHFASPEDELDRVGRAEGVQARMLRSEEDLVAGLAAASATAVRADGSDAVLLGCTCMSPVAEALQERCHVPVLDASRVGLEAAFAAAATGASAAGGPLSRRGGSAVRLVDAWLAGAPAAHEEDDGCPVCVVAPA